MEEGNRYGGGEDIASSSDRCRFRRCLRRRQYDAEAQNAKV